MDRKLIRILAWFSFWAVVAIVSSAWQFVPNSSSAFTANSIANLISWFDAKAAVTTSGSNVTAWPDQKGSNHLNCATSSPTYSATGFGGAYPTVVFSGGSAKCTVTTSGNQSPVAVFMVVQPTSGNQQYSSLFSGTNTATAGSLTFEVGAGADRLDIWSANHTNYASTSANTFTATNKYMVGFTYDGSTTLSVYIGATQSGTTSAAASGNFLGATWIVGSTPTGFSAVFAKISEIGVYSSVPSSGDITSLHTAWVAKWGVN